MWVIFVDIGGLGGVWNEYCYKIVDDVLILEKGRNIRIYNIKKK